jgi:hypothetical protein
MKTPIRFATENPFTMQRCKSSASDLLELQEAPLAEPVSACYIHFAPSEHKWPHQRSDHRC